MFHKRKITENSSNHPNRKKWNLGFLLTANDVSVDVNDFTKSCSSVLHVKHDYLF